MKNLKNVEFSGFGKKKTGMKKDGTEWTLYEYTFKVGDKEIKMSGFVNATDLLGDKVDVQYEEKPNPKGGNYNNLVTIESEGSVEESNKEYNVEKVGETTLQESDYGSGAFYGMVFNQTVNWIRQERKLALEGKLRDKDDKVIKPKDYTLDKHFETIFEHFWKLAIKKRKEKLE